MEKNLENGLLLDFYGNILTKLQKSILELYFNDDYSLSEIANEVNMSRQGVLDHIKRATAKLNETEESLKLLQKHRKTMKALDEIDLIDPGNENILRQTKLIRKIWED